MSLYKCLYKYNVYIHIHTVPVRSIWTLCPHLKWIHVFSDQLFFNFKNIHISVTHACNSSIHIFAHKTK